MKKSTTVFFLISKLDGGGVTSIAVDLAKALKILGYEIVFIYGRKTGPHFKDEYWIKEQGFKIHKNGFKEGKSISTLYSNFLAYAQFLKLLTHYKPAIVHCHSRSMTLFAVISKTFFKTRNVLTIHTQFFPKGRLLNFLISHFDAYVAISQEIKDDLKRILPDPDKIHKICNGVDESLFYPRDESTKKELKEKLGIGSDLLTLLVVARLEKVKSIDTLIKALALLKDDSKKTQCIVVGDGSRLNDLMNLAKNNNLDQIVHFVGYKNPVEYYAASDVFILPSISEGFAVVVSEAMLAGLTVIKTPTSGTSDQIIDGKTGFIFPFHDSQKLAEQIKSLINDPHKLRSMQNEAYQLAKANFTLKKMAADTARVYEGARS